MRLLNYHINRRKISMPWLYAGQNLALAQLSNLFSIVILFNIHELFTELEIIIAAIVIYILLIIINVNIFYTTENVEEFSKIIEPNNLRIKRGLAIWIYFLVSFSIFFILFGNLL